MSDRKWEADRAQALRDLDRECGITDPLVAEPPLPPPTHLRVPFLRWDEFPSVRERTDGIPETMVFREAFYRRLA